MKACSKYRKSIALLAADALSAHEARRVHAHIENCEACRSYLSQMSTVTEKLGQTDIASGIQTSNLFHQRVVRAIEAEQSRWSIALRPLQALLNWRVALPVTAIVLIAMTFSLLERRHTVPSPPTTAAWQATSPHALPADVEPTISNYQMIANGSLDKLDELLTRQGIQNPAPAPIYTASARQDAWN